MDGEQASLEADQPVGPHPLEHAVDVDGGEAERVGYLLLGKRQLEAMVAGQVHIPHPDVELAHQVADRLGGVAPAGIDDPGAKHRLVDQGGPPEGAGEPWVLLGHRLDPAAGDEGDPGARERGDAVVHLAEDGDVEVAGIAGDQEGRNLPRPIGEQFVARRPALEDEVDMVGTVTFPDDVAAGAEHADVAAQRLNRLPLLRAESGHAFQLRQQRRRGRARTGLGSRRDLIHVAHAPSYAWLRANSLT